MRLLRSPWLARVFVGIVLLWNVQCAAAFLIQPAAYAGSFELSGVPGEAAVRGIGLLFLMWNIPYAVAFSHPFRRWVSLVEAVGMQALGFSGEWALALSLPSGHDLLRSSIHRFMLFDGAGLVLLLAALGLAWRFRKQDSY